MLVSEGTYLLTVANQAASFAPFTVTTMPADNVAVAAESGLSQTQQSVFSENGLTESDIKEVIERVVPAGTKFRVAIIESNSRM